LKKFLVVLISLLLLVGCGKKESNIVENFQNTVNKLNNYHLTGEMELVNNEEKYNYKVDVVYKKGNYYKVSLVNKENEHEQIILKNEEGVYIVTPSLNKSFKFQSEWPTNSSQSYILETLVNDLLEDSERSVKEDNDTYIVTSKVNYPNNSELTNQVITFNDKYLPTKVVVNNSKGLAQITMNITNIDTKSKFDKEYFALNNSVCKDCKTETTGKELEDIVYPMYLPSGTTYSGEETIKEDGSERVILTYTGLKPFILIEEASNASKEHETTAVSGEVVQYGNVVGVLTETSLNWSTAGREYYIIGDSLSKEEILQIASSTATVALTK